MHAFESNPSVGKKPVEPKTVHNYLSGLRQAHILQGLPSPQLVTPMVDSLLKGQENVLKEQRDRGVIPNKVTRIPIT